MAVDSIIKDSVTNDKAIQYSGAESLQGNQLILFGLCENDIVEVLSLSRGIKEVYLDTCMVKSLKFIEKVEGLEKLILMSTDIEDTSYKLKLLCLKELNVNGKIFEINEHVDIVSAIIDEMQ